MTFLCRYLFAGLHFSKIQQYIEQRRPGSVIFRGKKLRLRHCNEEGAEVVVNNFSPFSKKFSRRGVSPKKLLHSK
jgi:hypothetical protein